MMEYEKFEELLKNKGVKTIDVANKTQIPPATFSDWKRGKSKPKIDKVQQIAAYFGVGVDYFL